MKSDIQKTLKIVLIVLIALTLTFIFVQSSFSYEKSSEQSSQAGDIVSGIVSPNTQTGSFIQKYIRKIAHFLEFAVLGLWTSLYVILSFPKLKIMLSTLPCALVVALVDETIQIFSKRGPAITDVWLDFAGFVTSSVVVYTVYAVIFLIKSKQKIIR